VPTVLRVIVRPFALAMRVSVISTDHGADDFDTGGVNVIVPLSIVVTVGAGREEIEFKAAWALLINPTTSEAHKIAMRKSAVTLVFIGSLSNCVIDIGGCDTQTNFQVIDATEFLYGTNNLSLV
jgi:hypothetical protein